MEINLWRIAMGVYPHRLKISTSNLYMDLIIEGLESRKNGEKYHDFVITDAINHIQRAQEALEEGLKEPRIWWNESMNMSKVFVTLLPYIFMLQQRLSQAQDQGVEENSQGEPMEAEGAGGTSGLE
jgi:hypothetical protein